MPAIRTAPESPTLRRRFLSTAARYCLARIDAAAPGADVHHWVETRQRERSEPCGWCSDMPMTASVIVYGDDGSVDCCTDCVHDAWTHVTLTTAPDRVTVDVALTPNHAYGLALTPGSCTICGRPDLFCICGRA